MPAELRLERNYRSTPGDPRCCGEPSSLRFPTARPRSSWRGPARPDHVPRFLEARDPDAQAQAIVDEVDRAGGGGDPLPRAGRADARGASGGRPAGGRVRARGYPAPGARRRRSHGARRGAHRAGMAARRRRSDRRARAPADRRRSRLGGSVDAGRRGGRRAPLAQPVARALCAAIADAGGGPAFADTLEEVGRAVGRQDAVAMPSAPSSTARACAGAPSRPVAPRAPRASRRWAPSSGWWTSSPRPGPTSPPARWPTLLTRLADLGYRGDAGAPLERDGVQIMTVHQAKGLEFDAVVGGRDDALQLARAPPSRPGHPRCAAPGGAAP